jgi:tetratricopeptide (TPR) repeat protein
VEIRLIGGFSHNSRDAPLFLDTYELLAQAADKEYAGWLWTWLGNATVRLPGLRVVVGSREALGDLTRRERRQEFLATFDQDDSDDLLSKLGVDDSAWRAAVFERLAGGHPLLTEMAADLWRDAQESGIPLPVEAIPELAGQEQAVEWLTGRILDRLDEPIKSAVRWAALLRRFDQEILAAVLPDNVGHLSDDNLDRLRRYSFVSSARVGRGQACHDLLRRVQNAYLLANKPRACRAFHARAAAHFAAEEDEVETLYHGLMASDEAAPGVWYERTHAAYLRLDWPRWSALLEVVESPELSCGSALEAEARFWRGQWYRWRYEMAAALQSYAQALDLFRAVGDRLGEANTRKAIGDVQQFQKENAAALQSYAQALDLFRAVGDRLGEANTLQAIGDVQQFQKENAAALQSYAQALDLFRAVGSRLGEANTLQAIGDVQQFQKENAAALQSYAQALDLFRAVGSRLGEANTILAISDLARLQGDFPQADEGYRVALELYQAISDNYSQARVYYRMGDWQRDQGNLEEARRLYSLARDIWLDIGLGTLVEQILTPRLANL